MHLYVSGTQYHSSLNETPGFLVTPNQQEQKANSNGKSWMIYQNTREEVPIFSQPLRNYKLKL